jgi:hypothetical protein
MHEPYTLCPRCHKRVEPDAPDVVYAREQVNVPGFGQTDDWIDGMAGFFHPQCRPEDMGWVRRQRPEPASA